MKDCMIEKIESGVFCAIGTRVIQAYIVAMGPTGLSVVFHIQAS